MNEEKHWLLESELLSDIRNYQLTLANDYTIEPKY